jgi:hypothetical protein
MRYRETQMTNQQRREAAAKGHRVRQERRDLRIALKERRITLAEALEHPAAAGMMLERLLLWMPRMGRHTVPTFLSRLPMSPARLVGTLTERERGVLVGARDW